MEYKSTQRRSVCFCVCVKFKNNLQGSLSLWLCHREQSSAASLLSTAQDEWEKAGRRERCHSERPNKTHQKITWIITSSITGRKKERKREVLPVSDSLRGQGRPHSLSASNTTSP